MKKIITILSLLVTLAVSATPVPERVFTNGEASPFKYAKILFPDIPPTSRPGGGGLIVIEETVKHKKSLGFMFSSTIVGAKLDGDVVPDFKIVAVMHRVQNVLSNSLKSEFTTLEGLIVDRKSNNKAITLAGKDMNSYCHIMSKIIQQDYKVDVIYVPYKTTQEYRVDLGMGRVDVGCFGGIQLDGAGLYKHLVNITPEAAALWTTAPRFTNTTIPPLYIYLIASNDWGDKEIGELQAHVRDTMKQNPAFVSELNKYFKTMFVTDNKEILTHRLKLEKEWDNVLMKSGFIK